MSLIAIIVSIFIVVTLSQSVGVPFMGMAIVYALWSFRKEVFPFSKSDGFNIPFMLLIGAAIVFAWFMVGSFFGIKTFSVLSSSYVNNFTIDNAFVKVLIWGLFIPLAETFFFLGVILPYIKTNLKMREPIKMIIAASVIGAIASLFHIVVRVFSDQALLVDFLFFFLSAIIVYQFQELKQAFLAHAMVNTLVVASAVGLIAGSIIG